LWRRRGRGIKIMASGSWRVARKSGIQRRDAESTERKGENRNWKMENRKPVAKVGGWQDAGREESFLAATTPLGMTWFRVLRKWVIEVESKPAPFAKDAKSAAPERCLELAAVARRGGKASRLKA
jgi:hypothetical protein